METKTQKRITRWTVLYADGCYHIIGPHGEGERKTLPLREVGAWTVRRVGDVYAAVDQDGRKIENNGILNGFQPVKLLSFGGSSLCYQALDTATGRIAVVKELYPYSLARDGLIVRNGVELTEAPGLDSKTRDRVRAVFARGFSQELEAGDQIRFYRDPETGPTNDPRFLSSAPLPFAGHPGALNRYQLIDTQAGTFLDRAVFTSEGRSRVVDELALIKQLALAVRVLHKEKRRVHLDLKPENILISKVHVNEEDKWGNHPVILIDFGSSFPVDEAGRLAADGDEILLTSTQEYMAPEVRNAVLDGEYDRIGFRSDLYSVFMILQRLLLSDAGAVDEGQLSCETIRADRHVAALTADEQDMLVELLRLGIDTRRIDTADKLIDALDQAIEVLSDRGIHPIILRKNARRIAEQIRKNEKIDPELLCEVDIEPIK